jgi:hypothetical protein
MEPLPEPNSPSWRLPFTAQDWQQTPPAVQTYLHTLRDEMDQLQEGVERLEARLHQHSTTSSRPPSSDSPFQKPHRRTGAKSARKGGAHLDIRGIARCSERLQRARTYCPSHVPAAVARLLCSVPPIPTK